MNLAGVGNSRGSYRDELNLLQLRNKEWMRRLEVVLELGQWMGMNISRINIEDGLERTLAERKRKGMEYVYCHLLLGKALFPDGGDPLFTDDYFDDISLWKQLEGREVSPGQVDFRSDLVEEFRGLLFRLRDERGIYPRISSSVHMGKVIQRKNLLSYVGNRGVVMNLVRRLERGLTHSGKPAGLIEELVNGLLLRYACIGGFVSNQHGSIVEGWKDLFSDMHECFASPLNRVFDNYYSVFDEDAAFGALGNLFSVVSRNGGRLPDGFDFEMNPPFEETILNRVADILIRTFAQGSSSVRLVLFVPDWPDTYYMPALDSLVVRMGGYASAHSARLRYGHISGRGPVVDSQVFMFVGQGRDSDAPGVFFATCLGALSKSVVGGLPKDGAAGVRSAYAVVLERVDRLIECGFFAQDDQFERVTRC